MSIPSLPIPSNPTESLLSTLNGKMDMLNSIATAVQENISTTGGLLNGLLKDFIKDLPIITHEIQRLKGIERSIFNLVLMVSITLAIAVFALIFYIYSRVNGILNKTN